MLWGGDDQAEPADQGDGNVPPFAALKGTMMPQIKIPPGPRGLPLLGCLPGYARDPLGFLTRLARQYGDAVRFRLGRMPLYLFSHPDQIEEVLRSQSQHFIKDRGLQISTSV